MKKDYAKRVYIGSQKKRSNQKWLVLAFATIVIIMGSIAFVIIKASTSEQLNFAGLFSHIKTMVTKKPSDVSLNTKKKQQETPEPEVQFSFYNELPNLHVEVPAQPQVTTKIFKPSPHDEMKSNIPQKAIPLPPPSVYFLQFGMYKELPAASELRISLLLVGIESEVEKVENGKKTSYRVKQGPYLSIAEAKTAQKKWLKKGIESLIKKEG